MFQFGTTSCQCGILKNPIVECNEETRTGAKKVLESSSDVLVYRLVPVNTVYGYLFYTYNGKSRQFIEIFLSEYTEIRSFITIFLLLFLSSYNYLHC